MNKVTNFNKNISHMLALRLCFCFLLANSLLACSPAPPGFSQKQLGDWSIHDAAFSAQGELALSVSQDIGLYTQQGDLKYLFQLPAPEGIWQLAWQNNSHLWVYDRYHLHLLQLTEQPTANHKLTVPEGIRFVAVSEHGLLLATETQQVLWYGFDTSNTLQPAQTLFEQLPKVSAVGTPTADHFYVATQQGTVWLWKKSNYNLAKQYSLEQPVHSLVAIGYSLYAITRESLSPLARQQTLQLWELSPTLAQQPILIPDTQNIASILALENTLIIGGGQSSWLSFNMSTQQVLASYQAKRRLQKNSRTIAMHAQDSVILTLNSRGTLQIWQKTRILKHP
ncbi:hypothetical protein CWE15_09910 [Aliidiomarina taiwanensis]|uniref:WD40 repeat domain-containing protein n=1 Tax=Aliidiomarina taiwanensis TaxID=946228 RepID=A0A432WZ18_9GAMM|nr:hypothetical protein [Aliidiomarina taiwanensis]RUO39050.1 hypothetical protein CWE15_09910 [Aliidiomarina taiwanensis]